MTRITRLMARRMAGEDSGFAMIFTILLTVIIVASSVAVAGLLLDQVGPTQFSKKSVRTVDAASAGLQAALGQLRGSANGSSGDLTQLPCSDTSDGGGVSIQVGSPSQTVTVPGDQLTGSGLNDGNGGDTASYRTDIVYFATDPTAHETDATTAWWSANAITCKAGLVNSVPAFAFIQSFGSGVALPDDASATTGNRTVHAIYQFLATNSNTQGGRFPEFTSGSKDNMCLDAGTSEPSIGTIPIMMPCLALGTPKQTWQYRNDLTLFYGGDTTLNYCIENMGGTPRLETCTTPAPPDPTSGTETTYPFTSTDQQNQEWSFNDNGDLSAPISPFTGSTGGNVSEGSGGSCLNPSTSDSTIAAAGAAVTIGSCVGDTTGYTAWDPDPQAGAGKSGGNISGIPGSPTNQYVNYAEFGRCMDITGQNVNATYLIDYPCKQAPNTCLLTWNQVWSFTAVTGQGAYGTMSVQYQGNPCNTPPGGTKYCLTAPSGAGFVTVTTPCTSPTTYQLWDPTGQIFGNYSASYLLVNKASGLCLAADPSQQPTYGSSSLVATPCDGSAVPSLSATKNPLLLKWNAPAFNPTPGLKNVQEDGGSTNH